MTRAARGGRPRGPGTTAAAPPLKWAGGKRWQLPYLEPLWRPHSAQRLVEPFCGGLAIALGLAPRHALLNDVNPHLVNFYRWLSRGLWLDVPFEYDAGTFYRNRQRFNELLHSGGSETQEAAALFYYLNRTGFNGLCRFNSRGEFNVPFGRYKRIYYQDDLSAYPPLLAAWTFTCGDFEQIDLHSSDFLYADPPYDVPFTAYARDKFDWDDQVRAARWASRHRGPVVLVNQATERIRSLYKSLGFSLRLLPAPRRISCTGDRRPALEVMALRNIE